MHDDLTARGVRLPADAVITTEGDAFGHEEADRHRIAARLQPGDAELLEVTVRGAVQTVGEAD